MRFLVWGLVFGFLLLAIIFLLLNVGLFYIFPFASVLRHMVPFGSCYYPNVIEPSLPGTTNSSIISPQSPVVVEVHLLGFCLATCPIQYHFSFATLSRILVTWVFSDFSICLSITHCECCNYIHACLCQGHVSKP